MLTLRNLEAWYGESQVLFGVDLEVRAGEVVSLLGRNGMGKTTTVGAVMGLVEQRTGTIAFEGVPIASLPSYRIAQAGIGLVPEGRRIFPNLTVRENLVATAANRAKHVSPWTFESVIDLFPKLAERLPNLGNELSGGEQQMLAIGRALMTNPRLLILDEATEGLAPLVRDEIWAVLALLKQRGQSILVVDKNIDNLIRLADRHYVIEKGHIVWQGSSDALKSDASLRERYLSV